MKTQLRTGTSYYPVGIRIRYSYPFFYLYLFNIFYYMTRLLAIIAVSLMVIFFSPFYLSWELYVLISNKLRK